MQRVMRRAAPWLWSGILLFSCNSSEDSATADEEGESEVEAASGGAADAEDAVAGGASDGHDHVHQTTVEPGAIEDEVTVVEGDFDWQLPVGLRQVPKVPEDNPMSVEKVELGRYLFYDKRLSENQTQSCASCHKQELAFTDGRATGLGSTGESHSRSAMMLGNVGYTPTLTWANPTVLTLERQALVPLFGADPVELGLEGKEQELLQRLRDDERYPEMFAAAFPEEETAISLETITKAIAAFERTLLTGSSPFDEYQAGDAEALSAAEKRGMELFLSERLECFHCHGIPYFTDSSTDASKAFDEIAFHNTGLYNLEGGRYPDPNLGLYTFTGLDSDMGRFKAPTLRNIAVTAPYMHDGSIATLSEVIDHYAAGGRTIAEGPNAGVGHDNPAKSGFVQGFEITDEERADLIAFLESLTDEDFLTDPRFGNPFAEDDSGDSDSAE